MQAKQVGAVAVVAVVVAGALWMLRERVLFSRGPQANTNAATGISSPRDVTLVIEGQPVTLVDGMAQTPAAADAASLVVTKYFGNAVQADFNADGMPDAAFIITQSSGGTGTFFYLAAAVGSASGFAGTNAVLLGDRIAPQTTEYREGTIIVNYAERMPGEPMTADPSVGVSKYFRLINGRLEESQP